MKREVAEAIVNAAGDGTRVHLYEGYSGRFMYGSQTTGVVAEDTKTLIWAVGLAVHLEEEAPIGMGPLAIVQEMKSIRFDNLGRDLIIY